jgi:hypothetical protein
MFVGLPVEWYGWPLPLPLVDIQCPRPTYALPMAGAELSRRVGKVVGYPPLSEMIERQRREFHEALLEAATFEDLPGKWQAAILEAEQNRPKLRLISGA